VSYSSAENGIRTIDARKPRLSSIRVRSKPSSFSNRLWWITQKRPTRANASANAPRLGRRSTSASPRL
jgi:hypothetical protein